MKIYRYVLEETVIGKPQVIKIPRHAQFVHSAVFLGQICMWFCVTDGDTIIGVPFIVNFTGDELDINSTYLATVINHKSGHVYHISAL